MRRKIAIALMSVGGFFVFLAAGLLGYNIYESESAKKSSAEQMDSIRTYLSEESAAEVDPFDEEMTVVDIDGYGYIGYLSVPSLELDLPVMSLCEYRRLRLAPCRYYGSTKTDNLVIAAHNYRFHFGYLGKLTGGDVITFTDMDGRVHSYTVTAVEMVAPTAVDQVKDTGDELVLYTCSYSGFERVVVRCRRATAS